MTGRADARPSVQDAARIRELERDRDRWEQICHEAERQRDDWQRLCREAEQQRDDWQRLCGEAERQRDNWRNLCREAESQRAEQAKSCREAEEQRDDWQKLCRQAEQQRDRLLHHGDWSPIEYSLPFSGVNTCREELAQLAVRERVLLYALVFSIAPSRVLEVGTFKGGSARIISAALDDLERGGQLITVDPFPELIEIEWNAIAHNARKVQGYFPRDFERRPELSGLRFDLAFIDGDHSYDGLLEDLRYLPRILEADSYVLLHDASNGDVARAIDRSLRECGFRDCGKLARIANTSGDEVYGGMRLLWMP